MAPLENPIPDLATATDAASRILSLQADLFLLKQELKTIRQIKRAAAILISLILTNLLLTFCLFWLSMSLHERGWSALQLALLSFVFFGILIAASVFAAIRVGGPLK